ncbi:MAG: hypothetical protein ACT4NV_14170 [Rhodoferax sp.]
MMTTDNLKKLITAHLGKGKDATAEEIARSIGRTGFQGSVNNALNALRTEGVVECVDGQGKGNELIYRLTSIAPAMPKPNAAQVVAANREKRKHIRLLLEAIGTTDDSGDGVLAAAAMAKMHRGNAAKLAELEAQVQALRHDLVNAEAGGRMMQEHAERAEKQRDAWRQAIGEISGEDTPANAAAYVAGLKRRIAELEAGRGITSTSTAQRKRAATPRRPFTVTGLTGYHAQNGRVTLFVDRRLSARSITLPADRLNQLAEMARGA